MEIRRIFLGNTVFSYEITLFQQKCILMHFWEYKVISKRLLGKTHIIV